MRRVDVPELLDSDAGTPEEVRDSLADLRWFNRYFGGHSTTAALLERVAEQTRATELSLLDVAAASADNALYAQEQLVKRGTTLKITVVDRASTHLSSGSDGLVAIAGDALRLPFADASFDVVASSLFLHHLTPEEAAVFLRESLRVARRAVIVNDLERGWFHWLIALAGRPIYRSRLTRHDAPVSVRRAYTREELLALVKPIGPLRIESARYFFFRIGLILWR